MKKNLIKATTTAIIASSIAGCGLFQKVPENSMSKQAVTSDEIVSMSDSSEKKKTDIRNDEASGEAIEKENKESEKVIPAQPAEKKNITSNPKVKVSGVTLQKQDQDLGSTQGIIEFPMSYNYTSESDEKSDSSSETQAEISPYQKELKRLDSEIEKAAAELVTAKEAYEKAKAEFEAAQTALRNVSGLIVTDENAVEMAKAYSGAKKAALKLAQEKLSAAEEDYNDVILQTELDFNLAEKAAANVLKEEKQKALEKYNLAVEEAEVEYDAALLIAQDEYNGEMEAARIIMESKTADSVQKYNAAVKASEEKYESSIKEAREIQEKAIAEAQKTYDENLAECEEAYASAIEEAENDPDYLAAVQARNDAAQKQVDAVNNKIEAETALQNARDELALAEEEKADKDEAVFVALDAKNAAEADLEHAQQMLEASREALEIARGNDAVAKQNVIDAEHAVTEAETRKAKADLDLTIANEALENAQGRIDAASVEVDNAEKDLAAANEAVARGVLGFYEFRLSQGDTDAQAAIDILNYASSETVTEEKRTEIGKEGDATSLENVLKVFDYIREGNDLAENDPNIDSNGFDLTYRLMAIAEINANMASYTHNHPSKDKDFNSEYAASENLAWGFGNAGTTSSPYQGWYYDEKPYYEKVAKDPTDTASYYASGHYRNLLSNSQGNRFTGFGINSETGTTASGAQKSTTFAQEFSWAKAGDTTYSVDEYEAMFLSYYSAVMESVKKAQAVLDEKNAMLTDLQSRGGLTLEEKDAIDQAKEEVSKAEDVLNSANNILSAANLNADKRAQELLSAEADVLEKEGFVVEENAVYEIALSDLTIAEEEAETAGGIVIVREDYVMEAENAVQNAKDNLEDANKTLADAENAMDEQKQLVVEETKDEKQALDNATKDDIVDRTVNEQQGIFDKSNADALAVKTAEIEEANTVKTEEFDVAEQEFNEAADLAESKLNGAETHAAEIKQVAEDRAVEAKQTADESARDVYASTVKTAADTKTQSDQAAKETLDAVKTETINAESDYSKAVDVEEKVVDAAENAIKAEESMQSAESNLAEKEENKDKFVNPEKNKNKEETEKPSTLVAGGISWSHWIGNTYNIRRESP